MKAPINNDNIYALGSAVYAKSDPAVKLVISDYKSRIYYCRVATTEGPATLAFYQRELVTP